MEEKSGAFLLSPLTALGPEGTTASSIWEQWGLRIRAGGLGTPSAFSTLWVGTWPLSGVAARKGLRFIILGQLYFSHPHSPALSPPGALVEQVQGEHGNLLLSPTGPCDL